MRDVPVIVVDNGSDDGTGPAVRAARPDATVVALDRNRDAAARTVGVEHATTPYVAFTDDDAWWEPGVLDRAARRLDADPTLALVAPRVLVGSEQRPDPICAELGDGDGPVLESSPAP